MAEPAFYRCVQCAHAWQRREWKTRPTPTPPAVCPHCGSHEQSTVSVKSTDRSPITAHVGQILTKKLESKA